MSAFQLKVIPEKIDSTELIPLLHRIERINPELLKRAAENYLERLKLDVPHLIPQTLIHLLLPAEKDDTSNMNDVYVVMKHCIPDDLTATDNHAILAHVSMHCGFWRNAILALHVVYVARQARTDDLVSLRKQLAKYLAKGTPQPLSYFIDNVDAISIEYINDALLKAEESLNKYAGTTT